MSSRSNDINVATYRPIHLFDPRYQFIGQREVEQLFAQPNKEQSWSPAVNIKEYDDGFELRADIPGIALSNVAITVEKTC